MELLLVEKNGWSKPIKIQRAITIIGSSADSDIQLNSPDIQPSHIQILLNPDFPSRCTVINLSSPVEIKVNQTFTTLTALNPIEFQDEDEIHFNDFNICVKLPKPDRSIPTKLKIQAETKFSETRLNPGFGLSGFLTLINTGSESACQFQIEVDGIPDDCYQIDPVPLLFSGASEDVRIRVFHRGYSPLAGKQTLYFKITAPESYPGEELQLTQNIYVAPIFRKSITLIDDIRGEQLETQPNSDFSSIRDFPKLSKNPNLPSQPPLDESPQMVELSYSPVQSTTLDASINQQTEEIAVNAIVGNPNIKIMRNPSDKDVFWDEKE